MPSFSLTSCLNCWKAGMPAFQPGDLSRQNLPLFPVHKSYKGQGQQHYNYMPGCMNFLFNFDIAMGGQYKSQYCTYSFGFFESFSPQLAFSFSEINRRKTIIWHLDMEIVLKVGRNLIKFVRFVRKVPQFRCLSNSYMYIHFGSCVLRLTRTTLQRFHISLTKSLNRCCIFKFCISLSRISTQSIQSLRKYQITSNKDITMVHMTNMQSPTLRVCGPWTRSKGADLRHFLRVPTYCTWEKSKQETWITPRRPWLLNSWIQNYLLGWKAVPLYEIFHFALGRRNGRKCSAVIKIGKRETRTALLLLLTSRTLRLRIVSAAKMPPFLPVRFMAAINCFVWTAYNILRTACMTSRR